MMVPLPFFFWIKVGMVLRDALSSLSGLWAKAFEDTIPVSVLHWKLHLSSWEETEIEAA